MGTGTRKAPERSAAARVQAAEARLGAALRRFIAAARVRDRPVTLTLPGQALDETQPVFILYEMEHGQRLAQYADRDTALAALERLRKGDPENATLYGVRQLRRGRPVGDYITETEATPIPPRS